ncbi:hypothetical protein CEXT_470151 [Caerostris extrusa]|uniref:Uncharacterized protein n=1 Tax=Caerostris extrusa TaxID=172846 RepID=A0AAV4P7E1_CAEEX|nr:hypothetical protein CEXT_470151 [Caerostris extrusa]
MSLPRPFCVDSISELAAPTQRCLIIENFRNTFIWHSPSSVSLAGVVLGAVRRMICLELLDILRLRGLAFAIG